jgi:putative endonuclease
VDTNVRFGLHEVDIIACTPENILVFCEVKTRSTSFFGDPSQAVSNKKLKSMQLVAREYLRTAPWTGEYRFDVIAVLPQEIEHFENVTWWS